MIDMVSVVIDQARETAEKRDEALFAQEGVSYEIECILYFYDCRGFTLKVFLLRGFHSKPKRIKLLKLKIGIIILYPPFRQFLR